MPLFFILSGYTSGAVTNWKSFKKKGIKLFYKTWLLAVIMIVLLGVETLIVKQGIGFWHMIQLDLKGIFWGSNIQRINLMNVGVMWFLIVFFWSKLLYNFFQLCFENKYNGLYLGLLAYFSYTISQTYWLPQAFDIVPIAAFFMWCGWYIKEINNGINYENKLTVLALGIVFVYWIACLQKGLYIDMSVRHCPQYIFVILEAIAGTICICYMSAGLAKIKLMNFFNTLGKHTLAILCIHHLDFYWIWWGKLIPQWYVSLVIRLTLDIAILGLFLFIRQKIKRKKI